jgi:peptidoglycan hydrolase CwlO-like protein
MATTIDEKTEITIPLKIAASSIVFIVVASFYVATTQNRIGDIEHSVELLDQRVDSWQKSPGRNNMDVELLKKDIEHLQKEIDQIRKGLPNGTK